MENVRAIPEMVGAPVLSVQNLAKRYGELQAVDGISFDLKEGEVLALLGRSGSGKSCLMRCISLLEFADSGAIYMDGQMKGKELVKGREVPVKPRELAEHRSEMAMVFQNFNLFPHLSVLQNVTLGMTEVKGVPKDEAKEVALGLLDTVGLSAKSNSYPGLMSGGQQQRVAIARAMAMRPKLMLFDEPTSALDPETIGEVLDAMRKLADSGATMIVATHEMAFAREVADRVIFLNAGKVYFDGSPSDFFSMTEDETIGRVLHRIGYQP